MRLPDGVGGEDFEVLGAEGIGLAEGIDSGFKRGQKGGVIAGNGFGDASFAGGVVGASLSRG